MKNILIVGAGVAGRDVAREINSNPSMGFKIVGFIDDDYKKIGKIVDGVKVLTHGNSLEKKIKELDINEVIIAIPSAEGEAINRYVKICSESGIEFKIVPRVKEIIEGKASFGSLRKVRVEDILGRPVVKSDVFSIKKFIQGKSVLITGAAGSIGSELSRQVSVYRPRVLILLDCWENGIFNLKEELKALNLKTKLVFVIANIQDGVKIDRVIQEYKPDYVFHAAAYKHVPLMEDSPDEAIKNNILGTFNLAKISEKYGVKKFILISTDKAADPINVMGATKLITEAIGQKLNSRKTKFITVRFGNVLDSYGSVVPIFRKQIEEGGPVTVTDPRMTRYFMTIPEAAQLILKAGELGLGGELFVLDMGKPVKIIDLAENMIRLFGRVPGKDIKIVFTGRRRGEKIDEVLFSNKEKKNLIKTKDNKIFVIKDYRLNTDKIFEAISGFEKLANLRDLDKIRLAIFNLVRQLKDEN